MAAPELVTLKDLHQVEHLELLAKQVVEGFIIGLHKSPFHGFSVEFAEHRLYNTGESVKNIDWKVYARTEKLFTKRFEEETNLRCQIVIDASSSMFYPEEDPERKNPVINKARFSAVAAASLMYLLKKQRDAFGLSIFSNKVEEHTQTRSSTTHYRLLMSHLENLLHHPKKEKTTSAAAALHEIAEKIHRRSLVVIFSDMMDSALGGEEGDLDELFNALQHLKYNKHEVILFHVVDERHEINFEFSNRPYLFVDLESGEKVRLHSNEVKDQYVAQMTKFRDQIRLKCAQFRIDFVEADVNKNFKQVLMPYLVKRSKMG